MNTGKISMIQEGGLHTKNQYKKSEKYKPLISIVMVVFNGEKFIDDAIKSIFSQNYTNIELIIIDGASTDNTLNYLKKYEDNIDYWISEPDKGQSDAFNKGFSLCQGKLVSWLNADDILLPNSIEEVVQKHLENPSLNWIVGNIIWMTEDKNLILARKGENWNKYLINAGILNVYGPTSFFTLELFNKVGKFKIWMHYRMDTELWWRFVEAGESYVRLENYIWALRIHKDAKTTGKYFIDSELSNSNHPSQIQMNKEDAYILKKYHRKKPWGKVLNFLVRLITPRYIISLIHSRKYKQKNIVAITKVVK